MLKQFGHEVYCCLNGSRNSSATASFQRSMCTFEPLVMTPPAEPNPETKKKDVVWFAQRIGIMRALDDGKAKPRRRRWPIREIVPKG